MPVLLLPVIKLTLIYDFLTQGTKKRKKKFRLTCIKNHIPLNFSGKSPLCNSQEDRVGVIADDNFVFAE